MKIKKKPAKVPGATIRGTYSTYANPKQRDLNKRLGHVVDMHLENLLTVEIGGWGTGIRILLEPGVKFSASPTLLGRTKIFCSRNT